MTLLDVCQPTKHINHQGHGTLAARCSYASQDVCAKHKRKRCCCCAGVISQKQRKFSKILVTKTFNMKMWREENRSFVSNYNGL